MNELIHLDQVSDCVAELYMQSSSIRDTVKNDWSQMAFSALKVRADHRIPWKLLVAKQV